MIAGLIRWSINNRFLVLLATGFVVAWGVYSVNQTPVDALPDLSDVQVIIKTPFPGQAPQVVEDQVTYPLTTAMLSVPKAVTVRGYSFFGDSYVYIIFEDGTDLYWARSRVLESLNYVSGRLPDGVSPTLGPDATGVGWIYEYALVDRSGKHDLSDLRSLQDWYLRYPLQSVPGVAEVASVGGFVKQYQVEVDPNALARYNIPLSKVKHAIMRSNNDVGGRLLEHPVHDGLLDLWMGDQIHQGFGVLCAHGGHKVCRVFPEFAFCHKFSVVDAAGEGLQAVYIADSRRPEVLVGAHLAGATLFWVVTVELMLNGLGDRRARSGDPFDGRDREDVTIG